MRRLLLLAAFPLALGCGAEARREFEVGVHHVSVAAGPAWQHVDQGRRQLLRREGIQLVIEDLGPTGREGVRREVQRARALWRRGRVRDARWVMRRVPVAPELFETREQRAAFWDTWFELLGAPDDLDPGAAEGRFDRVLEAIARMRDRPADDLLDDVLRKMGEQGRRSKAWRRRAPAPGKAAVIETWNRVTHEDPRRIAVWIENGYVLTLRTDRGPWPAAGRAFDGILRSLQITRPPAPRGATAREAGRRSSV